jgi:CHAD domain-containing protein
LSYKFKKKETVRAGIRRIAREEIDEAIELLRDKKADPEETVHEARKHFKRVRALLRLVRDDLGEEVYLSANGTVRTLGRRLAPVRNASVLVSALERLRSAYEKDFPAEKVASIQKRLVSRRRATLGRLRRDRTLSKIARELEPLRQHVRAWALGQEGFPCVEPGLRRAYRQGRKAQPQAYATRTDEAFHAWRKRAKDLRYHVELLQPVWPDTMKVLEKELHDLTDCLGDDHDFAELWRMLAASPGLEEPGSGVAAVIELIDHRRSELQSKAGPIGARTYSEKPRVFSCRIESYWEAWRSCPEE